MYKERITSHSTELRFTPPVISTVVQNKEAIANIQEAIKEYLAVAEELAGDAIVKEALNLPRQEIAIAARP